MIKQRFKSVYFADFPADNSSGKHIKVAFGPNDGDLYERVRLFSGQEMRELVGFDTYSSLKRRVEAVGESVNGYVVKAIKEQLAMELSYDATSVPESAALPDISPIQATFRGGRAEPFHQWYPYLEGYSPDFVRSVIHRYMPAARTILDPFSGTGTTPLTVSRMGRKAFYAEVNPLLQYLTEAKIKVLQLGSSQRARLTSELESMAVGLSCNIESFSESPDLLQSYLHTFGESQFFDPRTMSQVLKSRSFVDDLSVRQALAGELVTVAIVASLIPSSHLIRAGDVRYKTEIERGRGQRDFYNEVTKHLREILRDVAGLPDRSVSARPQLIVEDARQIGKLPTLGVDGVITSPPYLNGTNYFRNTKLELWFLRCLEEKSDLAEYRRRAVSAGINDVSLRRVLTTCHPSVEALVLRLSENAYDRRIPAMVQAYFQDMTDVFEGLRDHMQQGATLAIDIGDSVYGGVHVPTDQLLKEIAGDLGYEMVDEVRLRKRMSRSGQVLHQALLVMTSSVKRLTNRNSVGARGEDRPISLKWAIFKEELPHQQPPFSKRNWGHPLHSLCSYQGKMKPSLAAQLIDCFVPERGVILDPFAGVATIPFEGALSGRKAIGFDISPTALAIGKAKMKRTNEIAVFETMDRLDERLATTAPVTEDLAEAESLGFNGRISGYFHRETLAEVLVARRFFLERIPLDANESLVLASLMHILHGNRPYALSRNSHSITPFAPTGEFEYRSLSEKLRLKVERMLATQLPDVFVDGDMLHQDATAWWPADISAIDAVITSPPFFDSTRFHLANWMRLWFAGWSVRDFQEKPKVFVDERQKADFAVYEPVFRQARERMNNNGVFVMHLGKSRKCDMAEMLADVAKPWFNVADRFSESVAHCESHGIRDKGTVEDHQFLILN